MKIAIVTDTYLPRINGVSTSVRTLARELVRLGNIVDVHAPHFPDYSEEEDIFRVIRYPSLYLAFDPEDRMGYGLKKQGRAFIDQGYDIVHTQTPFLMGELGLRWGRKGGSKVVHTYHTFFTAYLDHYFRFLPKRVKVPYARKFSRRYCNLCDLIIAPSPQMRDEIVSYNLKTPVQVIPSGIELEQFKNGKRNDFRKKYGFSDDDKLLLFVGRLAKEKNIEFLLDVFLQTNAQIENAHLLIVGAGSLMRALKRKAIDLGLCDRIHFLGYTKGADLRDCYAGADLFVFSSVTETQGLVLIEAMAAGLPIVAVGRMGINDIMGQDRGGLKVEPERDEFDRAVVNLLTNSNLYLKKKKEALEEALKWSSETISKRMIEEYNKLLN